jgi:hypothetical protein
MSNLIKKPMGNTLEIWWEHQIFKNQTSSFLLPFVTAYAIFFSSILYIYIYDNLNKV